MQFILDFLDKEKQREGIITKDFPNGTKFFHESETKYKILHQWFNPLDDIAIDKLQHDVNKVKQVNYVFPAWYREFFKTTNGLNINFISICFHGEQTPMVNHPIYGWTEALRGWNSEGKEDLENWMAPFNLRYTTLSGFDINTITRWLAIGCYRADGTHILWDFKDNNIKAMYAMPVTTSLKKLRQLKESDYEAMIFAEWSDFETLFKVETERLAKIFEGCTDSTKIDYCDVSFWNKTLPKGHKDFIG